MRKSILVLLVLIVFLVVNIPFVFSAPGIITTIPIDASVSEIGIDEKLNKIYLLNSSGTSLTVIDGATDSITTTIPIRESQNPLDVNSKTGKVYVGKPPIVTGGFTDTMVEEPGGLNVIDGSANNDNSTSISVDGGIQEITVDSGVNRIFGRGLFLKKGQVYLIDGSSDTVLDKLEVGSGEGLIAFDSGTNKIFISELNTKVVQVVEFNSMTDKLSSIGSISLETQPGTIAVNPNTSRLYIGSSFENDTVYVINTKNETITTTIPIDVLAGTTGMNGLVRGLAVNPNTNKLYVSHDDFNSSAPESVVVVDGETNIFSAEVEVGEGTLGSISVNPITNKVYVHDTSNDKVYVIEGVPGSPTTTSGGTSTSGGISTSGGGTTTSSSGSIFVTNFKKALKEVSATKKKINLLKKGVTDKECLEVINAASKNAKKIPKQMKSALREISIFCEERLGALINDLDIGVKLPLAELASEEEAFAIPCPGLNKKLANEALTSVSNSLKTIVEFFKVDDNENTIPDICEEKNR